MRPLSWTGKIVPWLRERTALEPFLEPLLQKTVPLHRHTVWYFLGGATLFLLGLQIVSGALLMVYYQPTVAQAHRSVEFITTEVSYGWLIRSVHYWSANGMMALMFLHLVSVFFLKAYRCPRELTWVMGVLALFIVLGQGFSGYLLPWDERAFFATQVGTRIAGSVPLLGGFLLKGLRGGEEVTEATLTRFFAGHVVILPLMLAGVLAGHLLLVQTHGMSRPLSRKGSGEEGQAMPFFPDFLLQDMAVWVGLFAGMVTLATFWPRGLGPEADPLQPAPPGVRPEWYFLFLFETLKRLPAHVLGLEGEALGVTAAGLAGLALLLVPFLDRGAAAGHPSRGLTVVGLLALGYVIVVTALSLASVPPHVPQGVSEAERRIHATSPADWLGLLWLWGLAVWLIVALRLKSRHQAWLRRTGFRRTEDPGPPPTHPESAGPG